LIVLRSLVSFSYARILMQRQKNKVGELWGDLGVLG
jgi:hypothetical protein